MSTREEPPRPGGPAGGESPLLALLQRLARTALAARPGVGPVRLMEVEPLPDGVMLVLGMQGVPYMATASLRVRLTIQSVEPDRTRCTLSLPQSPGITRVLGAGLRKLPPHWVQQALTRLLGDAATVEGDTLILDHRALARRLRREE